MTDKQAGVDLGIEELFVTSDGYKSGNPKHTKLLEKRLALEQRRLAKKVKGSNNRRKQRVKVAKVARVTPPAMR